MNKKELLDRFLEQLPEGTTVEEMKQRIVDASDLADLYIEKAGIDLKDEAEKATRKSIDELLDEIHKKKPVDAPPYVQPAQPYIIPQPWKDDGNPPFPPYQPTVIW